MRTIDTIIIHCSATYPDQRVSIADITRWHQARGFRTIGYHYVIQPDGTIQSGRPVSEIGAHCQGHNAHSIGICYIGGLACTEEGLACTEEGLKSKVEGQGKGKCADTRTAPQKAALRKLLHELLTLYPHAQIHGHHDFNPQKACPCFDAHAEYQDLQP